ncbi:MAG: hypothetical protein A2X83_09550 [Desulfuromonadales bacterium GWD2_54_10]|nr:MAG: hypothetical protein A2X83_09550 [Desulfuromonadales bacterium GWD2_54_10]
MNKPSNEEEDWESRREQIIGLGEHSARKSYYPELQQRIHELEATKTTLASANLQLQAVLNAASEFSIIATDQDGLITIFNRGAEKMLGYTAEEMVGQLTPLAIHLASEINERAIELSNELGRPVAGFRVFVEHARDVGAEQHEWTYLRKDGNRLMVSLTVTVIRDEQGNISGFLGIAEDITRRKATERQLKENEELLGNIINTIPNPIFYKDCNGFYTGCNDAFCSYLGFPKEKIIHSTVYDLAPKKLADIYHQADLDLMQKKGTQVYETSVRYADEKIHDVIFYKSTMLREDGTLRGLVGVMLDISERKQAEKELIQKEELFHLLFEKSGDANLLIDGTAIIDCNEATLRILGYTDKLQIIDTHPGDISPEFQPDGRRSSEKANEMMLHAYEQGSYRFEWLYLRMNGTPLPVEVMLTAIPMHERWLLHTAWRDLTDRKQAEEEKERLSQSLLHAQKIESIGRLAGGVAHDFNNLLTPIMVYAEMLRASCGTDELTLKKIEGIISAACKARDLTRQLLAFGRKQVLEMKIIDLNRTLEAFSPILERTIREDIHISLKLAPNLGSIMADRPQIEQIIMNLAVNAQDAMPTGGALLIETTNIVLHESARTHPELATGPYVKLSVSDSGCGMDKETLDKIFEPFFTTKEPGKGTGLGLATVFGIVKQHKGHVNVYSEPGHGSTFTVYFPRQDGQAGIYDTPRVPELARLHHNVTILLVEDNTMVRELAYELLTDQGYSVLMVEEPLQAVALLETNRDAVDLLLSDVIMPGLSGPALYELLKPLKPGLKVIFMSGYNEDMIAHQYMRGDNPNYIQKPFSSHDLLQKIDEVLSQQPPQAKSATTGTP